MNDDYILTPSVKKKTLDNLPKGAEVRFYELEEKTYTVVYEYRSELRRVTFKRPRSGYLKKGEKA